jgi:hypothetical protein
MKKEKISEMIENKVTDHQLSKLKAFEEQFKKGTEIIGSLTIQYELQKENVMSQIKQVESDFNLFKSDLKEQYGDINIDTSTGEFTVSENKE